MPRGNVSLVPIESTHQTIYFEGKIAFRHRDPNVVEAALAYLNSLDPHLAQQLIMGISSAAVWRYRENKKHKKKK